MSGGPEHPAAPATPGSHPEVRPQPEELPRRLIARIVLATIMIGVALGFATHLILHERLRSLRPSGDAAERAALPPAQVPREVANVRQELFRLAHPIPSVHEQQRAELARFGWIDRGRRLAHIPIEAAMDVVAAGSLPAAGGAP